MNRFFLLESPQGSLTLRLELDPNRTKQAFARCGQWNLSYLDSTIPPNFRHALMKAGREFEKAPKAESLQEIQELISLIISRTFEHATLSETHSSIHSKLRWSGGLRLHPALFDAEVLSLKLGLRQLIKRDGLHPHETPQTLEYLHEFGLYTAVVEESDGRNVVLGAYSTDIIKTASKAEKSLSSIHKEEHQQSCLILGNLLGYPVCCQEAFINLPKHDDMSLATGLLSPLTSPPRSPLSLWLNAPLALISHAACSLECQQSLILADQILTVLDRNKPFFKEWWLDNSRRLHLTDKEGACWAVQCSGNIHIGFTIKDITYSRPDGPILERIPIDQDTTLTSTNNGYLLKTGTKVVGFELFADHRA